MKRLLLILFDRKNYVKIFIYVLCSAASQPLIAWSFSGLAGSFLREQPLSDLIIRNSFLLVFALIINWISDNLKDDISYNAELTLRSNVFSSIYSWSIGHFEKNDSGSYYNQIGRNIQMLKRNLYEAAIKIISAALSIIFIIGMLLYCHWMSLVVVLVFLIPLAINNYFMPTWIGNYNDRVLDLLSNMVVKLKDVLSGFFTAKFQEGNEYIEKTMYEHFSRASHVERKIDKLNNLSSLIATASVTLSQFSGLFVALYLMGQNQISFTRFMLIFQLGMFMNVPLVSLINSFILIKSSRPYIQETEEILLNKSENTEFLLKDIKKITFQNVSFRYPEKKRTVLKNFNFTFEKGKKYLLMGESGSGKSTLIKLLLGIVNPTEGTILYDDIDQKTLSHHEIYHHCGVVPQQVYIFADTIRRNIDLRGVCSDERMKEIIQAAKLEAFFEANHYTLDTEISNETLQVSGGEKARIGVARVLTMNKSIIIYDEVLSSLDSQNAKVIEDLILSDNDKITIHIAHKTTPEFMERYDEVIHLSIIN